MSLPSKKRDLPNKIAKMKARKRQKLDSADAPQPTGTTKSSSKKNDTKTSNLGWKKASFPEGLGDFEGLYGDFFEEISDTEVVQEGKGKVSFMKNVDGKKRKVPVDEDDEGFDAIDEGNGEEIDGEGDEEEWSGIEDDAPPAANEDVTKKTPKAETTRVTKKAEKKTSQPKTTPTPLQPNTNIPQTPFSILQSLPSDDFDDEVDTSAWTPLSLSPDVLSALSHLKFHKPTPIQAAAIPHILAGNDLIGKAPTGSGKTLAFGIPIYEYWLANKDHHKENKDGEGRTKQPTALIVLPTRELAHQIGEHLSKLCAHSTLHSPSIVTITGGLSIQKQRRLLAHADIVIATPGRLWEVISEVPGTLTALKEVKFLVIDEADRLLSEGNFKELEEVLTALDRKVVLQEEEEDEEGEEEDGISTRATSDPTIERQTLVFSATFSKFLHQKLSKRAYSSRSTDLLTNQASMEYLLHKLNFREEKPRFLDLNPISQMAANLREGLVECASATDKDLYLYTLLLYHPNSRALVFVNSISAVRRLVPFLENLNLTAYPLHSQMPQKARLRSIERFSSLTPKSSSNSKGSNTTILVATDVAARGLDIPSVHLVLHYHLPRTADTYVHRSGRTARADNPGSSILICAPQEASGVRRLVAQVHARDNAAAEPIKATKPTKKEPHYYLRTLDVDSRVVSALRPRASLAKKIADSSLAKSKQNRSEDWFKTAAEELGVDVDADEFEAEVEAQGGGKKGGKGKGRKERERVVGSLSKAEVGAMRAELRALLSRKVNVGVSERYLTGGQVDVRELLRAKEQGLMGGEFLGRVPELGLVD